MRLQRMVKTGRPVKMVKFFNKAMLGQLIKIAVNRSQTD